MTDEFRDVFGGSMDSPRTDFRERLNRPDNIRIPADRETSVGSGDYKAFGYLPTAGISETCDIRRWIDGTDRPEGIEFQYRFLMRTAYVGEEEIRLYMPDCIVVIEGRNLRELRQKLSRRQCTFVQQWSARVWPRPLTTDPFIERIEVLRPSAATS